MKRPTRVLIAGAAAAGAAIGGFAVASALTTSEGGGDVDPPIVLERPDISWLLPDDPMDDGSAPHIFSNSVSAISHGPRSITRDSTRLTIRAATENGADQVCVDLWVGGERAGWQCSYVQDISTGRAVGAFLDGDTVRVVGIAPDDATTVSIGGRTIAVESNLWFFAAPVGSDLSFRVSNADGTISTSVGQP